MLGWLLLLGIIALGLGIVASIASLVLWLFPPRRRDVIVVWYDEDEEP